jgi:predicted HTH domain antitoxin
MTSPAFLSELERRQVPINYNAGDLRADVDTLKELS